LLLSNTLLQTLRENEGRGALKRGFKENFAVYKPNMSDSARSGPHIKSYCCYRPVAESSSSSTPKSAVSGHDDTLFELDWFLLTSANVSQAAWGVLQNNNNVLYIKSYELGVLFLPELITSKRRSFSCTPHHEILGVDSEEDGNPGGRQFRFFNTVEADFSAVVDDEECVRFPVPYRLNAVRYADSDEPWVWDKTHSKPDVFGRRYSP
jgi:hypothetical protein